MTDSKDMPDGFADMTCAKCGHPENHHGVISKQCFDCPDNRKCIGFKAKSELADKSYRGNFRE